MAQAIHAYAYKTGGPRYIDQSIHAACGTVSRVTSRGRRRVIVSYSGFRVTCDACKQAGYGLASFQGE